MADATRVARAAAVLEGDWFLLTDLQDIRWLTGFGGSTATALLSSNATVHLFVDGRYDERARNETAAASDSIEVHRVASRSGLPDMVAALVGSGEVGIDPSAVTLAEHDQLSARFSTFRGSSPVRPLRRVKSNHEVSLMKKCADIAHDAVCTVVEEGLAGRTERSIRTALDHAMSDMGAHGVSFPTIVASGPNAAMPHHEPSDRVVTDGDLVIIDIGAEIDGYRSDMTRTVKVGRVPDQLLEMWDIVRRAQQAGLDAVRPGAAGRDVDSAVRRVFAANGVEHEYLHGTGHGVGLVIHEQPILGPACTEVLLEGEVVTVEPGLYRGGTGGVRIEDLVVVTADGCRILTETPKELSCPPSARTT